MNTESILTMGQEALSPSPRFDLSDETTPLLLGIVAALLLGVAIMLFDTFANPAESHREVAEGIPLAPVITGKTAAQLERELALVNEEVAHARAEREAMLKAIEEVTYALNEKLKEANLEQSYQTSLKGNSR